MQSSTNTDIELALSPTSKPKPKRLEGYPTFASWIAEDRDVAIYRKYESLSARNLLYQQSELLHLEEQLHALDLKDAGDEANDDAQRVADEANNDARRAAKYWKHYADENNASAKRHVELQEKIREKLKAYRKLSRRAQLPPSTRE